MLKTLFLGIAFSLVAVPAMSDVPAPAAATKYSAETPIETLVADPKAKTVLDAVFPGMTSHPMYDQFKSMSLKQLQPMASDKITDANIVKLDAELAALK